MNWSNSYKTYNPDYITWLRRHTGPQPLLLVYTAAVILDEAGRVLVQHRSDFSWSGLPGGLIEPDEDLAGCVVREVYEETGLHVAPVRLSGVFTHPDYTLRYPHGDIVQPWVMCFVCRVVGGSLRPDGHETTGLAFYPPDEAAAMMPPQHRAMLDASRREGRPDIEPVITAAPGAPAHFAMLRERVGSAYIILPGATAVVHDEAGRVLVMQRSDSRSWDLPGGLAELGETATGTVVRETHEETGLHVQPVRLIGVYSRPGWVIHYPNGDILRAIGAMFACRVVGGSLRTDGDESCAVRFADPGEILPTLTRDSAMHRAFWHDIMRPKPLPYIR